MRTCHLLHRVKMKLMHRRKFLYGGVLFSLIGFSVVHSLLPTVLKEAGPVHLFKTLIEHQNFRIPEKTSKSFEIKPPTDPARLSWILHKVESYSHWLQNAAQNSTGAVGHFRMTHTPMERALQLWTFEVFVNACQSNGLMYMAVEGTLLGTFRHHGYIPWDDDLDVIMNGSEWQRIHDVLSVIPGFGLHAHRNQQWKFYPLSGPMDHQGLYTYTFLDIFFFTGDDKYLWALTWPMKPRFLHRRSDVFPLQHRPFEHLMVWAPCNMAGIVSRLYNTKLCQTNTYDHREGRPVTVVHRIACSELHATFPFVFRHTDPSTHSVIEVLKIGNVVLQNITLPEAKCDSKLDPL